MPGRLLDTSVMVAILRGNRDLSPLIASVLARDGHFSEVAGLVSVELL
jgi:uncharacterized protein with PIN domain